MQRERVHHRTCHLCEAMCGVSLTVRGSTIRSVKGDSDDPLSAGHICPKAYSLKDIHEDPDRLKQPVKRHGSGWKTIGWDEAFEEVARGLKRVQKRHGCSAVGVYQGNPSVHNFGTMMFGQLFVRALRTRSHYSATSLDQLPQMLAALKMFGHQLLLPIPDIERTDFFLVLGANPLVSNGSLMTTGGMPRRLKALKERGGRMVVVDPRRTRTAAAADEHIFIRPGGDAFLLAAMVREILEHRQSRLRHLEHVTDGLEQLRNWVKPFDPEAVSGATGIEAATIRRLALALFDAPTGVVYGRVGVCTQEYGSIASWLVNVLNIITGNFDRPGGAMFTRPAVDVVGLSARGGQRGSFARRHSRVRNLPEFGGEYPTAALAEEIDTPGEGQVRALVTIAGNPVLSAPHGPRLEAALPKLDFMCSVDIYMNETTRHADIILPPTFGVEHDHYDLIFSALAVRNVARYSPALFERGPEQRHDWEIFIELQRRMAAGRGVRARIKAEVLRRAGPRAGLAAALRAGPYGSGLKLHRSGLTLSELERYAHGKDLGALEPCMPERLQQDCLQLADVAYGAEMARLTVALQARDPAVLELSLIGRRDLRSNNSWGHNTLRMVKGPSRCTVMMHPEDARRAGVVDGARVAVESSVGRIEVFLDITVDVMEGVVCVPHGWGHHRAGTRLGVAAQHAGESVNDITDESFVDGLSGNAGFSGGRVRVLPVEV